VVSSSGLTTGCSTTPQLHSSTTGTSSSSGFSTTRFTGSTGSISGS